VKKKYTKILGVGLSLVLLVALGLAAAPVSATTLGWSTVATPSAANGIMVETGEIDFVTMSTDGQIIFAYDNVDTVLWKSTNGGGTWTTTSIGTTLEGNTLVGLAISPDFATDSTIVGATATTVYRSINGGTSFGELATTTLQEYADLDLGNAAITSVAVADYYLGGQPAVAVGVTDTTTDVATTINEGATLTATDTTITVTSSTGFLVDTPAIIGTEKVQVTAIPDGTTLTVTRGYAGTTAATHADGSAITTLVGGVYMFRTDNIAWVDQTVGAYNAYAVAFSPNHQTDGQILAMITDATDGWLTTKFGANIWGADILNCEIGTTSAFTSAVIAFPDDYEWSSNNRVLVGTSGHDEDDVYRVHGADSAGASVSYDLNVNGASTETEVHSIAVSGSIAAPLFLSGRMAPLQSRRLPTRR